MGQYSFFDIENQLKKIRDINDFLFQLDTRINWPLFRDALKSVRPKHDPAKGGRPPFDELLMFKILVIKHCYNLSDEQVELQIRDRLSFRDFLGLTFADTVPDAKTIWLFAEMLKNENMAQHLFDLFNEALNRQGLLVQGGVIIDGTIVEAPVQHNSRAENQQIKNGETPERFTKNPHVGRQKDTEANWKTKNGESFFGYENHVLGDSMTKFILDYGVTPASVHDSVPALDLIPPEPAFEGQRIYGDSAYSGKNIVTDLQERGFDVNIHERPYRNKPLSEMQKMSNYAKSVVRCRIEHIFGMIKNRVKDETLRTIGMGRACFVIGMRNLVYNMSRFCSLTKSKAAK
jgi:IS5 family transposase